ncbi:hypothetical protein YC2023_009972 [Brassica napus]
MTRRADSTIPSTHGSQQYHEDMSTVSIDASSMATCSGGSEHCLHRSFAQPSRSKKYDRNQKYVDDSSPETKTFKGNRYYKTILKNKRITTNEPLARYRLKRWTKDSKSGEYRLEKEQARVQLYNDLCSPALELSQEGCL